MLKLIFAGVGTFIGLIVLIMSLVTVQQTERGVVTRFGEVQGMLEPGLHWINPFTQDVYKLDVTIQALELKEFAYSKDSQVVEVTAVVNYQINPENVVQVFTEVRKGARTRYVEPRSKDALKEVISRYTAQGIIDNRGVLTSEFKGESAERLTNNGITIQEVSIVNFDFDDQYEAAVQNKQVQEQGALAQENITAQEEEKKKQQILQAEAMAERTRLEAQALASQNGTAVIEKIYAEAQLEAAKRWNGQLPVNMYGSAPLPLINVGTNQ
jgi:prohibitin 2